MILTWWQIIMLLHLIYIILIIIMHSLSSYCSAVQTIVVRSILDSLDIVWDERTKVVVININWINFHTRSESIHDSTLTLSSIRWNRWHCLCTNANQLIFDEINAMRDFRRFEIDVDATRTETRRSHGRIVQVAEWMVYLLFIYLWVMNVSALMNWWHQITLLRRCSHYLIP